MLKMIERGTNALLAVGLGGLLVAGAAKQCLYVVDPGERAVLFDRFSGVKMGVCFFFLLVFFCLFSFF